MRMGGKATPFGVDEEQLDQAIEALAADAGLDLRGLHLFAGTQILDAATLARQWRRALDLAVRMSERLGRPVETIDVGGGLGIPYFAGEAPLDLDALATAAAELAALARDRGLGAARFVVEPGRYLVGEAGVYLARVVDVKTSRGKRFAILDGGMNHHLAASGNLGQVIKRNFPVTLASRLDAPAGARVDVVGPLCTPLDTLARDAELPEPVAGDLVAVLQSGAYARAASPLGFLSHATPPEVLVTGGQPRLVRRRGTLDDLLHDVCERPA
jgi:diaminopimelate decarboxylase